MCEYLSRDVLVRVFWRWKLDVNSSGRSVNIQPELAFSCFHGVFSMLLVTLVEIIVRLGSYFSTSAQLCAKRNITAFALPVLKELKPFEVFYLINLDWLQKFSCLRQWDAMSAIKFLKCLINKGEEKSS